jgi:GNAT superfamily N-acetyltransferase
MTDDEIADLVAHQLGPYIDERIKAGERPDQARRIALEQIEGLFPDGKPAPGHLLYRVLDDDGTVAGDLWIGPHRPEDPEAFWVWSVEIKDSHRGKGLGRDAMVLAEQAARAHGATELGLNVFGHNFVARRLYESMGYETTAVHMRKPLTASP